MKPMILLLVALFGLAQLAIARSADSLKYASVPAKLDVRKNAAHKWTDFPGGMTPVADWFDRSLAPGGAPSARSAERATTLAAAASDVNGKTDVAEESAWVERLFQNSGQRLPDRMRFTGVDKVARTTASCVRISAEYTYLDIHRQKQTGKAKLYLPDDVRTRAQTKAPLYYSAGYEVKDNAAATFLDRGWVVVSPAEGDPHPLVRMINADSALLHIARSLHFVDDAKVVIGGSSAGGYMALMLAAETFPLGGAVSNSGPINLGYNGAYWFKQQGLAEGAGVPQDPPVPFVALVAKALQPMKTVFGTDYGDLVWFRNSPLAHIGTITCSVTAIWSTADMLVPIDQIGGRWVRPIDPGQFPEGFTTNLAGLTQTREAQLRLTDVLSEDEYEVFEVPVPATAPRLDMETWKRIRLAGQKQGQTKQLPTPAPIELPHSETKRWSLVILEEGPPEPGVSHLKYVVATSHEAWLRRAMTGRVPAGELTPLKLERLMDRYAGNEWLPTGLTHLDDPESERADVVRGLTTYVAADPKNAAVFADLYRRLPPEKRVLEPEILQRISQAGGRQTVP
ncbi:MAG: alpha/beta hydrolase family protein [Planctomycetaceae bacterium]